MTAPDLSPASYPAEPPTVDLDALVAAAVADHVFEDRANRKEDDS